ncbi:MAG: hypothetical protein ACP5RC_05090 [Halothiobacillaceae bacterium]
MTYEDQVILFLRDALPGVPDDELVRVLRRAAMALSPADGRVGLYRWRLRLYEAERPDDPQLDSQPSTEPHAPPEMVATGFVGVVGGVTSCIQSWLAGNPRLCNLPVQGLDSLTLGRRIDRMRSTLSRQHGVGVWRFPLSIGGAPWLARVDLQRA